MKWMNEELPSLYIPIILEGVSAPYQWLRLLTPHVEGPGLVPGQGIRSHMLQLRPGTAK